VKESFYAYAVMDDFFSLKGPNLHPWSTGHSWQWRPYSWLIDQPCTSAIMPRSCVRLQCPWTRWTRQ